MTISISPSLTGDLCNAVVRLIAPVLHSASWAPLIRLLLVIVFVGGALVLVQ